MAEETQYAENISAGNIGGKVERAKRKALDIKPANEGAKVSEVQAVTKKLNSVLNNLSEFVKTTSSSLKGSAQEITRTAKESTKQYSRAVKEDVNVDKRNLVASTLSTATPIFGYFATKFMETDVWQKFSSTVKDKLSSGVKQGLETAKKYSKTLLDPITDKIRGMFNKVGSIFGSLGSGVRSLLPGGGGSKDIPKLAKGGFIGESGMAKIHPAEVVAPSEQILKQMRKAAVASSKEQEGIVEKISNNFSRFTEIQRDQKDKLTEQVNLLRQSSTGGGTESVKQFFTDFKKFYQGRAEEDLGIQERILNGVNMIRNSLVTPQGGILESLRYAFNNFLFEHPIFRNLFRLSKSIISTAFSIPGAILRIRGNYSAQMRGIGGTPQERTAKILGMLYPSLLHKLDQLILAVRGEEEGKTGWRLAGSPIRVIQSMLQGGKKGLEEDKSQAQRKGSSVAPIGAIGGGIGGAAKGIGEEVGLGSLARWAKGKTEGMTAKGREQQEERKQQAARQKYEPIPTMLEDLQQKLLPMAEFYRQIAVSDITGMFGIVGNLESIKDQTRKTKREIIDVNERTGATARRVRKIGAVAENTEKTAKYTEATQESTEKVNRRLGWQNMVRMIGMIGSTMSSVLSTVTSTITTSISAAASTISAAVVGKSMMGGGRGGAGRGILGKLGSLGKRGLSKIGGALGSLGSLGKRGLSKIGGGKGLIKGGGLLSAGLTAYEGVKGALSPSKVMKGVEKGEAGAQERTAAATGSILGGRGEGGLGQAAGQAAKWGSMGAAAGSVIPAIGTTVGGAGGAIIGGISGYIGGDKIASATNSLIEGSKSLLGSVSSSITSIFETTKEKEKQIGEKGKEKEKEVEESTNNLMASLSNLGSKVTSWMSSLNPFSGEDEKGKGKDKGIWDSITSNIPYVGSDENTVKEVMKNKPTIDKSKLSSMTNMPVETEKQVKEAMQQLRQSTEDIKKVLAENGKSNNAIIQNAMTTLQTNQSNQQNNSGGGNRSATSKNDATLERIYGGDIN